MYPHYLWLPCRSTKPFAELLNRAFSPGLCVFPTIKIADDWFGQLAHHIQNKLNLVGKHELQYIIDNYRCCPLNNHHLYNRYTNTALAWNVIGFMMSLVPDIRVYTLTWLFHNNECGSISVCSPVTIAS